MDVDELTRRKRGSSIRIDEKCKDDVNEWGPPHILVELTLAILKPDVVDYHNEIEDLISKYGFSIIEKKNLRLSEEHVEEFFDKCLDKTFLSDLKKYFTSDLSRVLLLARRNAIRRWLMIIGPDNSYTAKETHPKSLRAIYGRDDMKNAVHGSETTEDALREISYFFPTRISEPLLNESGATKFLAKHVNMTLVQALKALCYSKPSNPLIWLADWLLENNPYKPNINPVKYYVQ